MLSKYLSKLKKYNVSDIGKVNACVRVAESCLPLALIQGNASVSINSVSGTVSVAYR